MGNFHDAVNLTFLINTEFCDKTNPNFTLDNSLFANLRAGCGDIDMDMTDAEHGEQFAGIYRKNIVFLCE